MRYVGFATVAAVTIATAAGVFWFDSNSAAANFRKALDNANGATSVRIVSRDRGEGAVVMYIQGDRIRVEEKSSDFPVRIWDTRAKQELVLDPEAKTARLRAMTEENLLSTAEEKSFLFNPLAGLREARGTTVKGLGEEKVGGRPAKVFAFNSDNEYGHLWVDAKTDLPMRLKMTIKHFLSGELETDFEFEDWNAKFDAKLFDLGVPEGYKLLPNEKKE